MTINWPYFVVAVCLLWLPASTNKGLKRQLPERTATPVAPRLLDLLRAWPNWLALVCGGTGAWLLKELALVVDDTQPRASLTALLVRAGVLLVGVLAQTLRYQERLIVLGPLFYLSGVTALLADRTVGPFAVGVGWLFALACQNVRVQLPITAAALLAAGYIVAGLGNLYLMLNGALLLTPLLVSLMFQRPLVFSAKLRSPKS